MSSLVRLRTRYISSNVSPKYMKLPDCTVADHSVALADQQGNQLAASSLRSTSCQLFQSNEYANKQPSNPNRPEPELLLTAVGVCFMLMLAAKGVCSCPCRCYSVVLWVGGSVLYAITIWLAAKREYVTAAPTHPLSGLMFLVPQTQLDANQQAQWLWPSVSTHPIKLVCQYRGIIAALSLPVLWHQLANS